MIAESLVNRTSRKFRDPLGFMRDYADIVESAT